MRSYPDIGMQIPEVLLPSPGIDPTKWAVIACDQFTSQPGYWKNVEETVGDSPSTLKMILPEVFLNTPEELKRVSLSHQTMREMLDRASLHPINGIVLVERTVDGKTRHGVMAALDLEKYDFSKGSQSLIRATEGTILDRLPPRIRIREGAALEIPHILVLIDDSEKTVIEPLVRDAQQFPLLYDFDLMLGSGHLRGRLVSESRSQEKVVHALQQLAEPVFFRQRYSINKEKGVLLFAVGDGNHSLATAKSIWEKIKPQVTMSHPARYALVEIENIHDDGLTFEPIHRVLFNLNQDILDAAKDYFGSRLQVTTSDSSTLRNEVARSSTIKHQVGLITPENTTLLSITPAGSNLAVGSLQQFLDDYLKKNPNVRIDYIHGESTVVELGRQTGNAGFILPSMAKTELFKTVILDGTLPRKTFSMGEAHEKRFYMEARRITE